MNMLNFSLGVVGLGDIQNYTTVEKCNMDYRKQRSGNK